MKRLINSALVTAFAGSLLLTALPAADALAAPSAPSAPSAPAVPQDRCVWLTVTGKKVAVRRPGKDEFSARPNSPVHHYVYRGDRLRSCVMTFNRGEPRYRACGRWGTDWYIVRGGQIPATCVKRA
ncbi:MULTISPECIES: hypothetical protein [Streptomyces]|uniref:Secreted protein n=1 Tax=Streptomyces koelreuteriae TaxID=2838015 RepID=A0ABX8FRU4_9ACTN|nr:MULTISPECIES: hypothetical protein [Streptomyces]QWB23784.1 hypothetical protein KJK29_14915 [Streptomyces koelreuteriae]UUA06760.1 hypothetical protein NNW98_14985 [Streptomyces koelreuteriae]UUA14389.1 hypothetical protein NNW99_14980 [Streptomyces sp. CRCS-T-1]